MTTFSSYGQVPDARQRDFMRGLAGTPKGTTKNERLVGELLRVLETSKYGD